MAEVEVKYRGDVIAGMSASGTKTLKTNGKRCASDIEVKYTRPSGGSGIAVCNLIADPENSILPFTRFTVTLNSGYGVVEYAPNVGKTTAGSASIRITSVYAGDYWVRATMRQNEAKNGHKYYVSCYVLNNAQTPANTAVFHASSILKETNVGGTAVESESNTVNPSANWQLADVILTVSVADAIEIRISEMMRESIIAYFDDFRLVDLTESFGAGEEPTIEECRELFSGWDIKDHITIISR